MRIKVVHALVFLCILGAGSFIYFTSEGALVNYLLGLLGAVVLVVAAYLFNFLSQVSQMALEDDKNDITSWQLAASRVFLIFVIPLLFVGILKDLDISGYWKALRDGPDKDEWKEGKEKYFLYVGGLALILWTLVYFLVIGIIWLIRWL